MKETMSMATILIIDDDRQICIFLEKMIKQMGNTAQSAYTRESGLLLAREQMFDLILLDLDLPDGNGLQILPRLLNTPSSPEVIIVTGTTDMDGAEIAFKHAAWDYVQKPFDFHDVSLSITRALEYRKEKESAAASAPLHLKRTGIIGNSPEIENCLAFVAKAATTDASVLITGETGTGKELFARAIHENSNRATQAFIPVDCGALPDNLVESTLFGHEKGSFTGADVKRDGLFVHAEGGTLFLDEIGELPLNIQRTLLRTLQEKRIRPLGAKHEIPVDFRLVAATNRNLDAMVKEGAFREDLLFRIRAIEIKLPPLRDRSQDLHEIIVTKVHQLGQRYKMGIKGISPEFFETLVENPWTGNIRELINVIEYVLATSGSDPTLFPKHLPPEYRIAGLKTTQEGPTDNTTYNDVPYLPDDLPTLREFRETADKMYLKKLLGQTEGDREKAMQLSGLSQSRLYALLKKYDLSGFKFKVS